MIELLDIDELLFACEHELPLDKSSYSEIELLRLKEKVQQENYNRKTEIERRKREVLFG